MFLVLFWCKASTAVTGVDSKFADFTKFGKSRVQPEQSIKALILQSLGVSWSIPKSAKRRGRLTGESSCWIFDIPSGTQLVFQPTEVGKSTIVSVSCPHYEEVSLKARCSPPAEASSASLQVRD